MQRCQFCPPELSIAVWDKSLDSKLSFWKFLKCFRKFGNKFLKLEHGGDTKKKRRRRRRRRSIARGDGCSPLLLLFFLFILFFHSTWVYLFFFFVLVFIRRLSFLLHSESLEEEEEEEEEVVEAEEGNLVAPKTFVRVESTKPKNLLRSGWIFWWLFWPSSTSIRSISTEDLNDCTAKPTNPLAILKKKDPEPSLAQLIKMDLLRAQSMWIPLEGIVVEDVYRGDSFRKFWDSFKWLWIQQLLRAIQSRIRIDIQSICPQRSNQFKRGSIGLETKSCRILPLT